MGWLSLSFATFSCTYQLLREILKCSISYGSIKCLLSKSIWLKEKYTRIYVPGRSPVSGPTGICRPSCLRGTHHGSQFPRSSGTDWSIPASQRAWVLKLTMSYPLIGEPLARLFWFKNCLPWKPLKTFFGNLTSLKTLLAYCEKGTFAILRSHSWFCRSKKGLQELL